MPDQAEIDRLQHELTSLQDQRTRTDLTGDQATELNQKISSVQSKLNLAKFGMLGTTQPSIKYSPASYPKFSAVKEERKNPSDPYENWQDSDKEYDRRENMRAKEAEIAAPGHFTKEEAEKIKVGLDSQRAAEVDAQVLPEQKDPKKPINSLQLEISESITNLFNDSTIGRNEKRAQLKLLRQQIQSIEEQMDKNLI